MYTERNFVYICGMKNTSQNTQMEPTLKMSADYKHQMLITRARKLLKFGNDFDVVNRELTQMAFELQLTDVNVDAVRYIAKYQLQLHDDQMNKINPNFKIGQQVTYTQCASTYTGEIVKITENTLVVIDDIEGMILHRAGHRVGSEITFNQVK
jgi:hypothetical protein